MYRNCRIFAGHKRTRQPKGWGVLFLSCTTVLIFKRLDTSMKTHYLTKQGYDRIRTELEEMKSVGRQEAARAISEARDKGDLSENAEYDAAKNAQGMLEAKINELETIVSSVKIIDESMLDDSKVGLLTNVTIRNKKSGQEKTYKMVPEAEADLKTSKVSIASPIGQGLLGKVVGDLATVVTPNGSIEFEVLNITID